MSRNGRAGITGNASEMYPSCAKSDPAFVAANAPP